MELDRTGSNDAVFYQCRNRQFEQYINSFGFQTARRSQANFHFGPDLESCGSTSGGFDNPISTAASESARVNLSTGYYHAHQPGEYVRLDKVEELIGRVEKLLQTETERFSYRRRFTARKLMNQRFWQRKRLIALSDARFVRNHQNIADGRAYLWT